MNAWASPPSCGDRAMRSEQVVMLENLSKQGGAGYVGLVSLAEGGDKHAAEEIHDMAWEQLHSGSWHDVDAVWRDAYSLSSLFISACHEREGRLEKALQHLDMGLIMGGSLFRTRLETAITSIQEVLRVSSIQSPSEAGGVDHALGSVHEDSEEEVCPKKDGEVILPRCTPFVTGSVVTQGCEGYSKKRKEPSCEVESPNKSDSVLSRSKNMGANPKWKSAPYAEVLKKLPPGSLCQAGIDERWLPSLETFARDYFVPSTPVVIKNGMSQWPAMMKWKDTDYLLKVAGSRTVPVEIGEHYLAPGWKQELMTIGELLERSRASNLISSSRPYLAQHALFDQIPELMQDIRVPDYCSLGGGEMKSVNAWFGPAGTVTPLHKDPHHNLFAQVVGQKYVRLYSPEFSKQLHPFSEFMLCNSSQVDLDNPDYEKHPEMRDLSGIEYILEEGDMLYIPPTWWHYVRSLSPSFSVSFWWAVTSDDGDEDDCGSFV